MARQSRSGEPGGPLRCRIHLSTAVLVLLAAAVLVGLNTHPWVSETHGLSLSEGSLGVALTLGSQRFLQALASRHLPSKSLPHPPSGSFTLRCLKRQGYGFPLVFLWLESEEQTERIASERLALEPDFRLRILGRPERFSLFPMGVGAGAPAPLPSDSGAFGSLQLLPLNIFCWVVLLGLTAILGERLFGSRRDTRSRSARP